MECDPEALLFNNDARPTFCEPPQASGGLVERRGAVRPRQYAFPAVFAPVATRYGKIGGAFTEDLINLLERPATDDGQPALQLVSKFGQKGA